MQEILKKAKEFAARCYEKSKPVLKTTKKILKHIANYFFGFFNDKGKPSVHKSLILIFVFSVYLTLFQYVIQGSNPIQYEETLLFNFVPIFLLCCFLYFIIGKIAVVFTLCVSLMSILHIINHYKIKFRDEPLNPTDFILGKEAGNIVQGYDITFDPEIQYIIYMLIATIVLSFLFFRNKRPHWIISIIGVVLTISISVHLYSTVYKSTEIYQSEHFKTMYHETDIVSAQGLVYSLINKSSAMRYVKPEGYSVQKSNEILNRYPKNVVAENSPNVIAVMCEAYSDVQTWSNAPFTGENPYININELKEKGCYGKIFVPCFGGGTSSTEFEFLTGNNTYTISSAMPTAYSTHITEKAFSIAQHFKSLGYETCAIHPGQPWFYNRQNVYPRLGFNKTIFKDDLPPDTEEVNYYISDNVTADLIINDYKNHLETTPEKGYFSFTVTIQNHGPYEKSELLYDTEYLSKDLGFTNEEYNIINNYISGIKDSNDFLKKVYDYINSIDEPTVLIFFGDHLPYLDNDEEIFSKLGLDVNSNSLDAYINRYTTDYLIVGNDAYLESNTPQIIGQQDIISSNYLSVKMFQYANMELPQFQAFLNDMMQVVPIISKQHIGTKESETASEFDNMLKEYKILQYYNLRDYFNN